MYPYHRYYSQVPPYHLGGKTSLDVSNSFLAPPSLMPISQKGFTAKFLNDDSIIENGEHLIKKKLQEYAFLESENKQSLDHLKTLIVWHRDNYDFYLFEESTGIIVSSRFYFNLQSSTASSHFKNEDYIFKSDDRFLNFIDHQLNSFCEIVARKYRTLCQQDMKLARSYIENKKQFLIELVVSERSPIATLGLQEFHVTDANGQTGTILDFQRKNIEYLESVSQASDENQPGYETMKDKVPIDIYSLPTHKGDKLISTPGFMGGNHFIGGYRTKNNTEESSSEIEESFEIESDSGEFSKNLGQSSLTDRTQKEFLPSMLEPDRSYRNDYGTLTSESSILSDESLSLPSGKPQIAIELGHLRGRFSSGADEVRKDVRVASRVNSPEFEFVINFGTGSPATSDDSDEDGGSRLSSSARGSALR